MNCSIGFHLLGRWAMLNKGKQWGLLDMEDRVWLGDDQGPRLFEAEPLAQCAAIVTALQLEWEPWRVKAHPFTEKAPLQVRDEVQCTDAGIARATALIRELPDDVVLPPGGRQGAGKSSDSTPTGA